MTDRTLTSIFMAPTLGIDLSILKENGYINAYSMDSEMHHEDAIYLLFKPADNTEFRDFLEAEYDRTEDIIEDYDYPGGHVVIVYRLNPDFKKDFDLIRLGKYSKTSKSFQKLFPLHIKTPKKDDEYSLQYRIFNKTPDLVTFIEDKYDVKLFKEAEVWEMFEIEKETLNLKI
jgi:hypothetical protein